MDRPDSEGISDGEPISPRDDDINPPQYGSYSSRIVQTQTYPSYDDRAHRRFVWICSIMFVLLFVLIIIPLFLALLAFIIVYVMLRFSEDPVPT